MKKIKLEYKALLSLLALSLFSFKSEAILDDFGTFEIQNLTKAEGIKDELVASVVYSNNCTAQFVSFGEVESNRIDLYHIAQEKRKKRPCTRELVQNYVRYDFLQDLKKNYYSIYDGSSGDLLGEILFLDGEYKFRSKH